MPERTADSVICLLLSTLQTVCVCVCEWDGCVCVPACWRRRSVVPVWFSPSRSAALPSQQLARCPVPSCPPRDCLTSWTQRPREDSQSCWQKHRAVSEAKQQLYPNQRSCRVKCAAVRMKHSRWLASQNNGEAEAINGPGSSDLTVAQFFSLLLTVD